MPLPFDLWSCGRHDRPGFGRSALGGRLDRRRGTGGCQCRACGGSPQPAGYTRQVITKGMFQGDVSD